jgi:KilA-N domain/Meiotically up-regulated gene 113
MKSKSITVKGTEITIISQNEEDYISLTDLLKAKDGEYFVHDWLKNRNTLEFLSIWEKLNNPDFNVIAYNKIKSEAGLNSFRLSIKKWTEQTNAIGINSSAGRYGGTFAHKDIALEFFMWLSPTFRLFVFQNLSRNIDFTIYLRRLKQCLKQEEADNDQNQKQSFVYAVKDFRTGFIKIGKSDNPTYREKTLQSETPVIKTILLRKFNNSKEACIFEKHLHEKLKTYNVRGEWFNLSNSEISELGILFQ